MLALLDGLVVQIPDGAIGECAKWAVEHASNMIAPYHGERNRPGSVIAAEMVRAAQALYVALWKGVVVGSKGRKMPILSNVSK